MHNLKANFDKFIGLTKSFFSDQINEFDNFQLYPRNPKMPDCQIIALALTAESIGIDSESYFFGKLKSDYTSDFPNLIDRSILIAETSDFILGFQPLIKGYQTF